MKGWIDLNTTEQFDTLVEKSKSETIVVFKHSTRCSISSMAERRLLDIDTANEKASFYYLDLIAHRSLSNYISEVLKETHESPQILIIKNGDCTYDASHMEITAREVIENL